MESSTNFSSNLEAILLCSGLNEDCLMKILKYLNVCDLIRICVTFDDANDKSVTNLVNEHVISTKLFDFEQIQTQQAWAANKIFENFGASIKRLKVR